MKILFSGGETLGPVTPLLAIHEMLRAEHPESMFTWIGTGAGPERPLVEAAGMPFHTIQSGKWRRYASVRNIIDLFRIIIGFFQAFVFLWKEKPDLCISAGGFVSVPVHAAAWLLGIPTWIHVQDVSIGLAVKLMAPGAAQITTAMEKTRVAFPKWKTKWIGNPIRSEILSGKREEAFRRFGLDPALPMILATGGGTGSAAVNTMVAEAVPHLSGMCQIIHLTGPERQQDVPKRAAELFPGYHIFRFLGDDMKLAYAAADIVVSRGGFGTITEIAALQKAAIFIPKPGHQEENVRWLVEAGAALILDERTDTGYHLSATIKDLLYHADRRAVLGANIARLLPAANAKEVAAIAASLIP